jgi:hypothetical protein
MELTPMSPSMAVGFRALQGVAIGGGIGCISEIVDAAKLVIDQVLPDSFCAHFFFFFSFSFLFHAQFFFLIPVLVSHSEMFSRLSTKEDQLELTQTNFEAVCV